METTRKRLITNEPIRGTSRTYFNGSQIGADSLSVTRRQGGQITRSEGHQVSLLGDYNSSTGRYQDVGGNFETSKEEYEGFNTGPYQLYRRSGGFEYFHYGEIVANTTTGSSLFNPFGWFSLYGPSSDVYLDGLGTTAISRTIPTNPVADLATFIGELRNDGLPSLPSRQLLKELELRNLGGEYLNVVFGILPSLKDLKKFAEAYKESDKILAQLRRDSGKIVRRRYSFPDTVETVEDSVTPNTACNVGSNLAVTGTRRIKTTVTRKTWFSGAYTYYLPKGDSPLDKYNMFMAEANKLLGVRNLVDAYWNITPWSWALDWFANTGDVVHNLNAFANDGLVLRYGYMMETTIIESTYTWDGGIYTGNGTIAPISVREVFRKTYKKRRKATPFGFGLSFDGFSPRQLAIIAALGISKLPKLAS
jgi:hypothetical protein